MIEGLGEWRWPRRWSEAEGLDVVTSEIPIPCRRRRSVWKCNVNDEVVDSLVPVRVPAQGE